MCGSCSRAPSVPVGIMSGIGVARPGTAAKKSVKNGSVSLRAKEKAKAALKAKEKAKAELKAKEKAKEKEKIKTKAKAKTSKGRAPLNNRRIRKL